MMTDNNEPSYEDLKSENKLLKSKLNDINKSKENKTKVAKFIGKKGVQVFLGQGLKNALKQALNEFNKDKKISRDTLAELGAHTFWRLTRVGVFAIVLGILPSLFLIIQTFFISKQNDKIDRQNLLVDNQNIRIEQQTHLIEADRRSSQVFILGEVLSDVNKELENLKNQKRILSNSLVGRIISLSRAMKPYRYLEEDSLISRPLSPERGQLLISLIESKIDSVLFVDRILSRCDFSYADLKGVNLENVNLSRTFLKGVDLRGANLKFSAFEKADLTEANLENADLRGVYFYSCNLKKANLKYSDLRYSDLSYSLLDSADVRFALLKGSKMNQVRNNKRKEKIVRNVRNYFSDLIDSESYKSDSNNIKSVIKLNRLKKLVHDPVKDGVDKFDYLLDGLIVNNRHWFSYHRDTLKIKWDDISHNRYKTDSAYSNSYNQKIYNLVRNEKDEHIKYN